MVTEIFRLHKLKYSKRVYVVHYRFSYMSADLCKPALQPGISKQCKTIRAGVSRDMPVYSPSFRQVLITAWHRGRAQVE